MDEPVLEISGRSATATLPGIKALLIKTNDCWKVGQFFQTGKSSRNEVEQQLMAAFPDLNWWQRDGEASSI